jgi:hypothetical protein
LLPLAPAVSRIHLCICVQAVCRGVCVYPKTLRKCASMCAHERRQERSAPRSQRWLAPAFKHAKCIRQCKQLECIRFEQSAHLGGVIAALHLATASQWYTLHNCPTQPLRARPWHWPAVGLLPRQVKRGGHVLLQELQEQLHSATALVVLHRLLPSKWGQ